MFSRRCVPTTPRTRQRCPRGETKLPIGERLPHGTIPLTAITVIVVSIGLALVGQVLFSARRKLRATTLHSAWTWAVIAFVAWAVSWVSDLGLRVASKSLADHLWYGSAVLALCPAIAVLGSRRPGARVWTWFIQVPLLLVLGWPVLSLWLQGSELRGLQLETPQLVAYVLVLVMGTGNYCGTRFTLPVLCFAAACACLAVSSSAACPAWLADREWSRTWGTGLLVAAILLASRARGSRTHVIPHAVSGETSERGGVSPPVLGRKPSLEEPGGLRRPARKPLTLGRARHKRIFGVGSRTRDEQPGALRTMALTLDSSRHIPCAVTGDKRTAHGMCLLLCGQSECHWPYGTRLAMTYLALGFEAGAAVSASLLFVMRSRYWRVMSSGTTSSGGTNVNSCSSIEASSCTFWNVRLTMAR